MQIDQQPLIQIPFCTPKETKLSGEYRWRCDNRGGIPYVIIQWSTEGEGYFKTPEKAWKIPPGYAFVSVLPEIAEYGCSDPITGFWTFSWLNVYGDFGIGLWRQFRANFPPVNPLPHRSPAGFTLSRLIEMRQSKRLDAYETTEMLFSFFTRWWKQLTGIMPERTGIVEAAKQYFDEHYADAINVKEMAALTGLSREHFTRIFQKEVGIAPATYLRVCRVKAAKALLEEERYTWTEIAQRCGFASARQLRRTIERNEKC